MNSLFEGLEQKRWTWVNPDMKTFIEIDLILTNKMQIEVFVGVMLKLNLGSDYRRVPTCLYKKEEN